MEIAIMGSGIVGEATGRYLSDVLKHHAVFYDIKDEPLAKLRKKGYHTTMSLEDAVDCSQAAFICVPTNNDKETGKYQVLTHITDISKNLGEILKKRSDYYTVVVKSTVIPGTTKIVGDIISRYSSKKIGKDFGLCMNPEFLTFIENSWTSDKNMDKKPQNEEKIVIGEYNKKSGDILKQIYKNAPGQKFRMSLEEAEFIKYMNNYVLPARISVFNEVFLLAEKLNERKLMTIDTHKLAQILSLDPRIGKYGSVHGQAYGGPCFKKDPQAFLTWAENLESFDPAILRAVVETNNKMKKKYGTRE